LLGIETSLGTELRITITNLLDTLKAQSITATVVSLVGLVFGIAGPSSSLGPVLGGLVFDLTRSYAWAFGGAAVLNLVALAFLAVARPPSRTTAPAAASSGAGPAQ